MNLKLDNRSYVRTTILGVFQVHVGSALLPKFHLWSAW